MKLFDLLQDARNNNICLWVDNDELKLSFTDAINEPLLEEIKCYKHELIQLFSINQIFSEQDFVNNYILKVKHADTYPLSFAQERMLFIEDFEQGTSAYHIPYLVKLDDEASVEVLTRAINTVVNRHPVLKSVYTYDEQGAGHQHTLPVELTAPSIVVDSDIRLIQAIREEIGKPFSLHDEPSMRVRHYVVDGVVDGNDDSNDSSDQYLLMLWHHIAMDGWSTDIFLSELSEAYQAIRDNRPVELPQLPISYGDYAHWQRAYLQGEVREQQLAYWRHTLSGYEPLALPTDKPRPSTLSYAGQDIPFTLSSELSQGLKALAKTQHTTLYTVLLSAFSLLLSKYSHQDDILIGSPSDNRHHSQTQGLIGMFVNSLVLRSHIKGHYTLNTLINETHEVVMEAKAHQDLPFEQLVDALSVSRDPSRHPLFQVMFSVQGFGEQGLQQSNLPFSPVSLDSDTFSPAKYDISLFLTEGEQQITGSLNFATSLFNEETMSRLLSSFQTLLKAFINDSAQTVDTVNLVSAEEQTTLLKTFNDTEAPYPQDKSLVELFEAQVKQTPENTALVFEGQRLTYQALNEKANQLARQIRQTYQSQYHTDLPADTLIALYLDRSLEMVISILATLKAGAAYVPISPEYPSERSGFILTDTQTPIIISHTPQQQAVESLLVELAADNQHDAQEKDSVTAADHRDVASVTVPQLLLADSELLNEQTTDNLSTKPAPNDLAYVIYTSGTTGQPKGVMVEHQGVVSLVKESNYIDIVETDVFLQWADPSFDAATFEIWGALSHGARLVVPSNSERKMSDALARFIEREYISILWLTRSLFDSVCFEFSEALASLRYLLVGGEALTPELMREYLAQSQIPQYVLNGYGPTESTTFTTTYNCYHGFANSVPIGQPINTRMCYILDAHQQLLPLGAVGELYIGGAGLARGYLNRAELTEARFIPNPFASEADIKKGYTRLYRTGDLVRWLPDGNLEYLGRNDQQVKIRGYRIELGEIASCLSAQENVQQAVVVDIERQGSKVLAAYVVPSSTATASTGDSEVAEESTVDIDGLHQALSLELPEYMVPSSITVIDKVPLTINGKLDRRALPAPVWVSEDSYRAPRNELEVQLCAIWQEVLGVERVGIDDNFFRLGGDSIQAIRLTAAMRGQLDIEVPLATLFAQPTIAGLMDSEVFKQNDLLITALTPHSPANQKLFMIHPGGASAEVYAELAQALSEDVNCLGINNYNLVMPSMIDSLPELAEVYLSLILERASLDKPIHILGWSLGGLLAMEVAYQLEQRGADNISLYLLDTIIQFPELQALLPPLEEILMAMEAELNNSDMEADYIKRVLDATPIEYHINQMPLSGQLQYTKITLFKAMLPDTRINGYDEFQQLVLAAPDNHVAQYSEQPLTIINMPEHHHGNLLEDIETLTTTIMQSVNRH